jgi:ubiquinone/menaquinone biosynthesis C-methylase UbiE
MAAISGSVARGIGRKSVSDMKSEEHHGIIREEFDRQADTMPEASIFTDSDILDRIMSAARVTGGSRALDLGCGPGIVTEAFAVEAGEVVALDLSPEMIRRARQRCEKAGRKNVRFAIGKVEKLPFHNASFDVIVTRLTLHHFPDLEAALSEMVRVLQPDGRIVIADIVSSHVPEESELHNALEILRDPSHVRMISHTELKHLIRSAGLVIKTEDNWIRQREFTEWMQITGAPERSRPLYVVMRELAGEGIRAGIDLQIDGTTVIFKHRWILITAESAKKGRSHG